MLDGVEVVVDATSCGKQKKRILRLHASEARDDNSNTVQ